MGCRSVERAVIVADGYFGHGINHGFADGSQSEHHTAKQVPNGLRGVVPQRRDLGQLAGGLDDLIGDRAALDAVTIEKRGRGLAASNQCQFPREIERILHAGVHALTAGRTVDVRGIAGHEDASGPEMADLALVDPKPR